MNINRKPRDTDAIEENMNEVVAQIHEMTTKEWEDNGGFTARLKRLIEEYEGLGIEWDLSTNRE